MPITPAPPYPKSKGDPILSKDWNQVVDETIRLDKDKVNRAGDTINGSLSITGALNFGSQTRQMVNLWSTNHGIGVQDATTYLRTDKNTAFFKGGSHSSNQLDPGGGIVQMVLQDDRVGIGTSQPMTNLHVRGNNGVLNLEGSDHVYVQFYPDGYSAGRKSWIGFGGAASNNLGIANEIAGGHIVLQTQGGNVGIGVTSPNAPLHIRAGNWDVTNTNGDLKIGDDNYCLRVGVANGGAGAGDVRLRAIGGTKRMLLGAGTEDSLIITENGAQILGDNTLHFGNKTRQMINLWSTNYGIGIQGYTQYFRTAKNFVFYKGGSHNDAELDAGGGQAMLVINNGNVGIGTTTPDRNLTIANASGANYFNVKDGTHEILMGVDGNGGILSVMSNHDLSFRSGGNSEKMRIKSTGNVGIGTNNPATKLHVLGNRIRIDNGSGKFLDMRTDGAAIDIESTHDLYLNNNGQQIYYRKLNQISSRDLKDDIHTFSGEDALKYLAELDTVTFTYKDDAQKDRQLGFIAEDTPEIFASPDRKGIIPIHFIALLTRVAQEQQKMIHSLQMEIASLKLQTMNLDRNENPA